MRKMTREEAIQLRDSPLWAAVCAELDTRIESVIYRLKTCNPEDLPSVQKEMRLLEDFKTLPQVVIDRESDI